MNTEPSGHEENPPTMPPTPGKDASGEPPVTPGGGSADTPATTPPVDSPADTSGGEFVASDIGRPRIDHSKKSIQDGHIEVIMDVPITLSLEIGRTRITIGELLQLNPGSVVKLDRMAGEPMDVMVNGCLIAKGEVVTVGEKFGVRIAEVVSPEERIKSLR